MKGGGPEFHLAVLESGPRVGHVLIGNPPGCSAGDQWLVPCNFSALPFLIWWRLSSARMQDTLLWLGLELPGNLSPGEPGNVVLPLSPFLGSERFL